MGSVSGTTPGISTLLQTLDSANVPALTSVLSSPTVQAALENAPAGDLAQLSAQAIQLQETNLLFGDSSQPSNGFSSTTDNLLSLLASQQANTTPASPTSTDGASTPPSPATLQAQSQLQQVQAILGIEPNTNTIPPGSLINVLG